MNAVAAAGLDGNIARGLPGDAGEIYSVPAPLPPPRVRENLRPGEEEVSLPAPLTAIPNAITPLTRFLGPLLTVANPAWSGDPVSRMRALQKKLVEHSLILDEGDRSECLAAITVVETAVQLRLRLQQMRMTLAEMVAKPEDMEGKPEETEAKPEEEKMS